MIHPPNCAGYLVSAPATNSSRRIFSTFPVDFEPPWLRDRRRLDIRMTPLTAEEYHRPLVDIAAQHGSKLRDPEPPPPPAPPPPPTLIQTPAEALAAIEAAKG